jgi:hypothetical protein
VRDPADPGIGPSSFHPGAAPAPGLMTTPAADPLPEGNGASGGLSNVDPTASAPATARRGLIGMLLSPRER